MVRIQSENENTHVDNGRAEVILAAYHDVGLIDNEQAENLQAKLQSEILELADAARGPELEYFVPLSKIDRAGLRKLVRITDPKLETIVDGWHNPNGTWVFSSLWAQYKKDHIYHDESKVGIATAMIKTDGLVDGLMPDMTVLDRAFVSLDNGAARRKELIKGFLNPAGLIAINIVRRFEGYKPLGGFTEFPGVPAMPVPVIRRPDHSDATGPTSVDHRPYASQNEKGLTLGMTSIDSTIFNPNSGFRFTVSLPRQKK